MTARNVFVDIDAAFAEHEFAADPITIKVVGRQWTFDGNMPSVVLLRMARWTESGTDITAGLDALTVPQSITLIGDLVPEEYLRQWSQAGLSITTEGGSIDPRMSMILQTLLTEYTVREALINGGGDDVGEPRAAAVPPPFSGTGQSSNPTSPESTGSTSPPTSEG